MRTIVVFIAMVAGAVAGAVFLSSWYEPVNRARDLAGASAAAGAGFLAGGVLAGIMARRLLDSWRSRRPRQVATRTR